MRRAKSGFTLIEILVVIVILGILTSIAIVGVTSAITSSKVKNTELLMNTIKGSLENYRTRWGDYPPSTLTGLGTRPPNDTNNGIEALVASLSSEQKGGVIFQPPSDELYCNTDGDQSTKNVTGWFFGDTQLRELQDHFGTVLVYLHHRDYARPDRDLLKVVPRKGEAAQTIAPHQSGATQTFAMPDRFQIFSAGKDRTFGTPDDIRGW